MCRNEIAYEWLTCLSGVKNGDVDGVFVTALLVLVFSSATSD